MFHRTINMPMEVVRRILNLAASEWLDESGMTWLEHAPKIRLLPRNDVRDPYPIPSAGIIYAKVPHSYYSKKIPLRVVGNATG